MTSEEIMITGRKTCSGSIQISGSKNATLPLMAACLLTDEEITLQNVPQISDIEVMKKQLRSYGVTVTDYGSTLVLRASRSSTGPSPNSQEGSKTRGAFLVLGPLLARFGTAKVYPPGGCRIVQGGDRPVDYHIDALEEMGAASEEELYRDHMALKADQGLHGARIRFPQISVGATENIVMAACLANGQTEIRNAAMEPEVIDLVEMLKDMGAHIQVYRGQNSRIVVNGSGGTLLNGCTHTVIPDRIEAGTYAIAAAMTGGALLLKMDPRKGSEIMVPVLEKLQEAGVTVTWKRDGLEVRRVNPRINPVNITTGPFPGFPTDLLPQWVTFMTLATGSSIIQDTIYDNRFTHVEYLEAMGARFTRYSDRRYKVHGGARLSGTRVIAKDLRAGAALILAGLVAEGTTVVKEFHHVRRGYANIEEKLKCWSGSFQQLPRPRSGFHGGQRPVYY